MDAPALAQWGGRVRSRDSANLELEVEISVEGGDTPTVVAGVLIEPPLPLALCVLAHGAAAGFRHPLMATTAETLASHQIASLRYNFAYMEARQRRPDPPPVLHAAVRAAVLRAHELRPDLPLLAGGRSMGGRMTSQAEAHEPLPGVLGLVFFAFPLHPPKRPGTERADHLDRVGKPMLFLSGTRDDLADLELLRGVCAHLGECATLHVVEGADHSFKVLKRSGRSAEEVQDEIGQAVSAFCRTHGRRDSRTVS